MMQWIISSGVLIAVVIALRFFLRGKISLRLQYALWLLVLARLLVPVSFGTSDLSVMNAVPERRIQQSVTIPTENVVTPVAPLSPAQNTDAPLPSDFVQNTTVADTVPKTGKTDWAGIARIVWLVGVVVLGLTFLDSNLRFGRKLRRSRRSIADTGASLPVYESAETETPCLFGLIKPSIYVTPDACADASTLRYALAHEQTHYRHGDHLWAVLRGVCLALHWYNPLVWWAAELSRRDAELACDEATICRLGENERAAYGRTLIRMTSEQRPALLVTATMMTDSGKGLRERITLLVKKPKTAVYTAALVLLVAGISVACTFTNGNAALTDPFGKEYSAELVYQETEIDFIFDDGVTPGFRIGENGKKTITVLHTTGEESNSIEVEEVELTRENFDSLFRDDAHGWTSEMLNAAKLRRATVNAWHATLLGETNWPREMYLLQQKDGTLYLAMGYDKKTIENLSGRAPFFRWVFRLNEKTMPVYDSMEDYALAQIKAIRENGISYYVRGKDDFSEEFFDTVEDVRVKKLSCLGELSDFAPDGTLELWCFSAEAKPSNQAGNEIMLVGGQNLSDDGYFSDGYHTYLVMLRKDDGYHTLRSFISNDGYEVGRYPTVGAYLHDAYCEIMGFLGPYSLIESLFRYTDGYGREVSDNGILTHGDGWYFYLPSGEAWVRSGGIHDLWYSAYSTESTITVNAFDATVEETAASLIGDGWTKETSGALTVYRRCCPSLPQSLIPSFDAYESVYLYERPEGGHYEVLTVWYDLADEVNEWGWSPKAQVAAERQQLETMVRSFTVVPADETPDSTDFLQWCSRFRDENVTNLSISVDGAAALGYTGETLKSMASELTPLLRALTDEQRVQLPDADVLDDALCLMIGDNKDEYMINLSADGNYANTIHVLGALRADEEGKYFRSEAYYDAPWIASWIRAKAISLLEGDLPEVVLPIEEETHEDDGVSQTVQSIRGEFPGGTRLTVGTFELPQGAVTFSGTWSPSYASVCAIVKPSSGDGAVIYFKPGESVSLDFGQSGSCDIVLLAPKEGIDGTMQIAMPRSSTAPAESGEFSSIDDLLRHAGFPSITGFTANSEELVINSELIAALQDAAQTLKVTGNPPAPTGDYVSAVLSFEGGQSVAMSVGNKAGQVCFTRDEECKIAESRELSAFLYALSEARNAELHDLDQDACCEALCWTSKSDQQNLIIYGVRDGKAERLDVNETLGCAASDYAGNIADVPQDCGNLILAIKEIGKAGELYRYRLGTLEYVTAMEEAESAAW